MQLLQVGQSSQSLTRGISKKANKAVSEKGLGVGVREGGKERKKEVSERKRIAKNSEKYDTD